jgi:tetratricopeptide (TPR) repeat protein
VIVASCAARTYDRNGDWLDAHRFWRTGAEASPGSYKTLMNVVTTSAGLTQDEWDLAIRDAQRALAILDKLPDDKNVGRAYRDAGMFYREVGDRLASKNPAGVASAGTTPDYWCRLSLSALLRSEKIELVFDENYRAENARRGKPGLTAMPSILYLELGRTYMRLKDLGHAVAAFERGRVLESAPELLEEAAEAYRQAGDPHAAAIALDEAYTVDSNRPQILGKLVDLYGKVDPTGCAVTRDSGGAGLNPDCPLVHADICAASRNIAGTYVRRGQPFEAAAVRKRAIEYLGCAPDLVN